ncbi:malonyl-ACP O-methyltransferase BioC [Wenzhouxiangella marina]|uniref:Malonyl-[acyl-carrier protein] O-methyltransferase n=1 Tax=Wenzhouxiangella marina TaxID=1579979 RepID=A0A0K0XZV0_9GAMM|nr:malonyl-ACP O-methyltransferase BioC [Wenzhouxiangella marina]AKS43182.1 malonyl-CoA O-methyltransferase [Wenzhouxiangella marina]MBB6087133.1 malonyl-CoA O-methyltransferase [Wenzhouxiangella marina]
MSLDSKAIARQFGRAADSYDGHAALQREVGERLMERLDGLRFEPQRILDLGCGTGAQSQALHQRFPGARLIASDLAGPMLVQAARRRGWWRKRFDLVQADARALPIAEDSLDLVYCNLMLQWCEDPAAVFANLRRALKPGGLLLISTFGLDTLRELRQAWAAADSHPHVGRFTDVQRLGSALTRAGFAEPVLDTDWITSTYSRPQELLSELKGIGATNADQARTRGLTSPTRLRRMLRAYETFRQDDGRYPATWEVVYASAWAPEHGQPMRTEQGEEASIPISRLGRLQR